MTQRYFLLRNMQLNQKMSAILAVASLSIATSAMSQDSASIPTVSDCQAMQDATLRLKCYDALFSTNTVTEEAEPVTVSTPTIKQSPKIDEPTMIIAAPKAPPLRVEDFGDRSKDKDNELTRPVISPSKSAAIAKVTPPEIKSITQRVTKIDTFGYKKLRITLENGQVWEQVGSVTQRPPKLSSKRPLVAEIRKAALSSFSLQFNGKGRAFKVRRVR